MNEKGKFRKPNNQNDFNLDDYLAEQAEENKKSKQSDQRIEEQESSFLKNSILGLALISTSFLWYHDWSPRQAYQSVFGSSEMAPVAIEQSGNRIEINIPDIQIPDINIPLNELNELERAIEEELANFPEQAALPSATDYLVILKEKGLIGNNKLSTFDATQLYSANVPVEYLEQLNAKGYLGEFNFVAIGELYKNRVPLSYIDLLKQNDFLDNLNFVGISELYKNDVSMDYLSKLDQGGYLSDLNFVAITEYYKAGVTPEFLNELKQKDLYADLNFVSVIELYKSENQ